MILERNHQKNILIKVLTSLYLSVSIAHQPAVSRDTSNFVPQETRQPERDHKDHPMTCSRSLLAAFALAVPTLILTPAHAQWSHNPAVNTGISTAASDQNQAKILPTADGGAYIVWLDGIGTGWDTRLQRIDARGIKQWPDNGVLVANTAFSSTQDYGFALDADGNAVVTYRDDGNVGGGPVQIKVQKVDPAGSLR